jgi:uncharacterized membrane protein
MTSTDSEPSPHRERSAAAVLPGSAGLPVPRLAAVRSASAGHAAFAAILIAVGVWGLARGGFVGIWDSVPHGAPLREALAYLCAVVSLAGGLGLLWRPGAARAARVLFAYLLAWLVLVKLPYILRTPLVPLNYESCAETAVIVAGAWVLYVGHAARWDRRWLGFIADERGVRLARGLYGLALIGFGVAHFAYLQLTAPLVPAWLPAHVMWAYFTGGAYIAAGAAVLVGPLARLAATLSAVQMGLFTLLVWVPVVATGRADLGQWSELAVSAALTAGGWVVAESYRGARWLARVRH